MYNKNKERKVEERLRKRKLNFKELVMDNKQEIKSDLKALERIEAKIDDKHSNKLLFSRKII